MRRSVPSAALRTGLRSYKAKEEQLFGAEGAISLLVVHDDYYKTCAIDCHSGQRFAHHIREDSQANYLDELLKARSASE